MKRIYTKSGDRGMTRIRGGVELPKDDMVIETNGTLDELNAVIGVVRSFLPDEHRWQSLLNDIQDELLIVMSHIATPEGKVNPKELHLVELTSRFEAEIDGVIMSVGAPKGFIVPAGRQAVAHLHLARTVVRRAERRLCTLRRQKSVNDDIASFINRMSDLFFAMACDMESD